MEKSKKKKIILCVFYLLLTVAILAVVLSFNDFDATMRAVGDADIKYVLIAIALLLLYLVLYPIPLCALFKVKKVDVKLKDVYIVGMTEHFFNGVTPFSTGGQPLQAYMLSRKKVKVADSTGLLIMNFVIFMLVTNIYALCSLFYFGTFTDNSAAMTTLAIIGFSINFLVFLFMVSLGTSRNIKKLIVKLIKLVAKLKFLKKFLEPKLGEFEQYAENTQKAFKELWRHKGTFFFCFFMKAITMFIYYAITFYVIKAMGGDVSYKYLFMVVCSSAFAITMVVFVPTPGSSGGIEWAFANIILALGLSIESTGAMLIWRLITFYLALTISFVFYIVVEIKFRRDDKKAFIERKNSGLAADGDCYIKGDDGDFTKFGDDTAVTAKTDTSNMAESTDRLHDGAENSDSF